MPSTIATHAALLKTHYYGNKNTIRDLTLGESPLLGLIAKKEDAGQTNAWPIVLGHNQSSSADFASSQASAGSIFARQWAITMAKHYNVAQIDGDLIAYTKHDANAFLKEASASIDSSFRGAARRLSLHLYRDGFGDIGRLGNSSFSTAVATLGTNTTTGLRPDLARNFEVGMRVVFAASQSGHALRASGAFLTVVSVDEDAGTVTFDANLSTITGIAQGDWMFAWRERQDSATPARIVMSGLGAWVPSSTPTSTPFFGVDRSVHPTRLGGHRINGSSLAIRESLRRAAVKVSAAGGRPTHVFLGFDRWNDLAGELGSAVEYTDIKPDETAAVSFRSIVINGPKGPIKVVADNACPEDVAYMLQLDTWRLLSAGRYLGFLDDDGLRMLRQSSADGYEVRIGGYHQLACEAPGYNARISLPVVNP